MVAFKVTSAAAAVAVVLSVTTGTAQARGCGDISANALPSAFDYNVFTYKVSSCKRARSILAAYLRTVASVDSCSQGGCVRKVKGWKCRTPQVHGTVVGCVPQGASWGGPGRPFVGISRF